MEDTTENKPKKHICIGLLAHVDAGKTTLSEALLYTSGSLRELGRVDKGSAFLDTHSLERLRGITIFSKQARMQFNDMEITLLDTPGHVDFSAEMERTLQVLDYVILVISGIDGVQSHTRTLWKLIIKYRIPVFVFVNKMDQMGTDQESLMQELKKELSGNCIDFSTICDNSYYEEIALCDESLLEEFIEKGSVCDEQIRSCIKNQKIVPCFFGSALKLEGVETFMQGLERFTQVLTYPQEFSAKVYKIGRDPQGNRLTFLKMTGGTLKVRDSLPVLEEKVNQIRIYSGEKFSTAGEIAAGRICAVTGLEKTQAGMNLGKEKELFLPFLEPVLTYRILWPNEIDALTMLSKLRILEEEEPQLHIIWNEELQEVHVKLMGGIQLEIFTALVLERFGIPIEFGEGTIVYKETIQNTVEGIGHYEPLRHYAEVHLLMTKGGAGSGLVFESKLSVDELERNWQRLILTHLSEKEHRGVLIGAPITDMVITLVAGKAHKKHTEGGDFRQAVYRAVRQGLKQAESVLLEPWYQFIIEVPEENVGRTMADMERLNCTFSLPETRNGIARLIGSGPVYTLKNYQKELTAYTRGNGKMNVSFEGYRPCHNAEQIIEECGYDSERDLENSSDSIFCSHGAGFIVKWNQVWEYMHLPSILQIPKNAENYCLPQKESASKVSTWIGTEEIDAILEKNSFANAGSKSTPYKKTGAKNKVYYESNTSGVSKPVNLKKYLLVDGYNIVYAWEELKSLASVTIEGARGKLMDILCNYQSIIQVELILVFDAYRVENHKEELFDYHNIHVVYTAQAETADRYIERFAHDNKNRYDIMVATSDYMEQIITRGQGSKLLSARELEAEVKRVNEKTLNDYADRQSNRNNYIQEAISADILNQIKNQNI